MRASIAKLSQWLTGKQEPEDRRREKRLPAYGQVTLLWRDDEGRPHKALAPLVDISPSGLAVRGQRPFNVGETIFVTDGRVISQCIVRRCCDSGGVYDLGLERQRTNPLPEEDRGRFELSEANLAVPA